MLYNFCTYIIISLKTDLFCQSGVLKSMSVKICFVVITLFKGGGYQAHRLYKANEVIRCGVAKAFGVSSLNVGSNVAG